MNLRIRSLVLVSVLTLALTACGDDVSEDDYADAMSSALSTSPTKPLAADKADCVSDEFVPRMGVERLEEGGGVAVFKTEAANLTFTSIHLTEAEADDLFDDFVTCGADMKGRVLAALGDAEAALPEGMVNCLRDAISEEEMRAFFVPLMTNGDVRLTPRAEKKLQNDFASCTTDLLPAQG